jgi:molybdopterin converting factor small subunit
MTQPTTHPMTLADDLPRATRVRVLFFGPVRVRLGVANCDLACAKEMSTSSFWSQLIECYPELAALRSSVRLARNGEFLGDGAKVGPGDEMALIPPVSGG